MLMETNTENEWQADRQTDRQTDRWALSRHLYFYGSLSTLA